MMAVNDSIRIPAGLFELASALEAAWPQQLAELQASGEPLNAVDDLIDRSDAGALIPEPVSKEIIKSAPAQSAALSLFRRVTMSSKKERQPVLSALPQAYWVGGDTGLKQTTQAEWANKYLIAEELAVVVPVPEAVLDDSEYDIWGETKPLLVEAFGQKIDQAVFFGTGGAPATLDPSVVEHADAAGNEFIRGSVVGQDLAEDINKTMSLPENDGYDVNGFAAKRGLKSSLRGLRDANGGLLFQPSLQAGTPATLYAEPISYASANGAWDNGQAELVTGDFSKGIVGVRQDITFKIFTEGVISDDDGVVILNLMQQDAVAMRAVMRIGWKIANPINRDNQVEANRSPFGVLRPAGFVG